MSAHDRWLIGHRTIHVRVVCTDCGEEWDGSSITESGQSWLEPREDCPKCGSSKLDATELDELDIAERRLESRGVDF